MPSDSVAKEKFTNKLKELGFKYKGETERSIQFRRGTLPIFVRKLGTIPTMFVRKSLRRSGLTEEQVREFINSCDA